MPTVRRSAAHVVGVVGTGLGMLVLTGLAVLWLADADALPRALELQVAAGDGQSMSRVASAFRATFDLFAVAVMGLLAVRRHWRALGQVALLSAVFIPGVDAVLWWSVLDGPTPGDVLPHLLVALPLLVGGGALLAAGEDARDDAGP